MGRGHGDKLTRKQEEAIAALLSHTTVKAAAEAVPVNEKTLRLWLKDPAFLSAYREARRGVVEQTVGQLQQASSLAVAALVRNLDCQKPGDEIRAALGILEHAVKAVEVYDLAQAVADLKRQ